MFIFDLEKGYAQYTAGPSLFRCQAWHDLDLDGHFDMWLDLTQPDPKPAISIDGKWHFGRRPKKGAIFEFKTEDGHYYKFNQKLGEWKLVDTKV